MHIIYDNRNLKPMKGGELMRLKTSEKSLINDFYLTEYISTADELRCTLQLFKDKGVWSDVNIKVIIQRYKEHGGLSPNQLRIIFQCDELMQRMDRRPLYVLSFPIVFIKEEKILQYKSFSDDMFWKTIELIPHKARLLHNH